MMNPNKSQVNRDEISIYDAQTLILLSYTEKDLGCDMLIVC